MMLSCKVKKNILIIDISFRFSKYNDYIVNAHMKLYSACPYCRSGHKYSLYLKNMCVLYMHLHNYDTDFT